MRRAVLVDEAPLLADALVPVLGERLGHLDAEAVQQQVAAGTRWRRTAGRRLADRRAHRDDVERGVVELIGPTRPARKKSAMHRNGATLLAWVVEAGRLGGARLVGPHDEVVAVAVGGEVAVDHLRHEHAGRLGGGELLAERRPDARLELVVGLRTRPSASRLGPELPLVAEQRRLVDVLGDVVERRCPLTTREPRNGGVNTGLSVATSGERARQPRRRRRRRRWRSGSSRPVGTRPKSGSHSPLRFIAISESSVDRPSNASRP